MTDIIRTGIILIFIGFALVFAGTILSSGEAEFGGLVMIGPIPLVFGTSPGVTLIAMFTGLLLVITYFILLRRNG